MNATLVEIQRIQTRLQQLSRSQSPSTVDPQSKADHSSHASAQSIQLPNDPSVSYHRATSRVYSSPHRTVISSSPQPEHRVQSDPQTAGQILDQQVLHPKEFQRHVEQELSRTDGFPRSQSSQFSQQTTQQEEETWLAPPPSVSDDSSPYAPINTEVLNHTPRTALLDVSQQQGLEVNEGYGREAIAPHAPSSTPSREHANGRRPQTNIQDSPYAHHRHSTHHNDSVLPQLFQQLNLQAQHVNTMASALSHALTEMSAIAERVDHQRALEAAAGRSVFPPDISYCLSSANDELVVPYVTQLSNGALVIEAASIGSGQRPPKDGRKDGGASAYPPSSSRSTSGKASGTASGKSSSPSKKSAQNHSVQTIWPSIRRWLRWLVGLEAAAPTASKPSASFDTNRSSMAATHSSAAQTAPLSPTTIHEQRNNQDSASFPSLGQSLVWVGGSAMIRVFLDTLLVTHPTLWPLAIAIVVTPAAIAIYRTVVDSRVSFALGRRLILIMFGLLLGGRFS